MEISSYTLGKRRVPPPREIPRQCFLHIGAHKTGSTSIQAMLSLNESVLSSVGIHVPKAGSSAVTAYLGHHNIAWQLNGDPRFDPAYGTLDDLVTELQTLKPGTVVLSSEDFEYLYAKPKSLAELAFKLGAIGYEVHPIVYLRTQAEYIESLFAELVKHGLAANFDSFVDSATRTGHVEFRDRWVFCFRYSRLLQTYRMVFGENAMIVRPYVGGRPDALITDFVSLICGGAAIPELKGKSLILNQTASFMDVLHGLHDNVSGTAGSEPSPEALVAQLFPRQNMAFVEEQFKVFDSGDSQRISAAFSDDNQFLADVSGVELVAATPAYAQPRGAIQRANIGKRKRLLKAASLRWRLFE